jgi:hypothetical protein
MTTDSEWLAHWVQLAPPLTTETMETITTVLEEQDEDEPVAA